jgi:hypothetical protein
MVGCMSCVFVGCLWAARSRWAAALEPLSSRPDWLLGQPLRAWKSGPRAHITLHEQCTPHQRRGCTCKEPMCLLHRALSAAQWCMFSSAGARARRARLTCRCLPAVCQTPSACSAVQRPCPSVHPRVRATLLRAFPGRLVQRWPRTRRSSDPLQMRASRLYFRPKAQIDPRELVSGVGMHVRSRADDLVCPPAPFWPTAAPPHEQAAARRAWLVSGARPQQLVPARARNIRQTEHIVVREAVQQVSAHCCLQPLCSRLRAASSHAPPPASAHIVMCRATCLCLLSHRSSMLLQRGQLEDPHQLLHCSCFLPPRALLQHAPFRLARSSSRCAPWHLLAPVLSLVSANTSPTLASALVDPLRLEPGQQRSPWRTHLRHASSRCRTHRTASLLFRFLLS